MSTNPIIPYFPTPAELARFPDLQATPAGTGPGVGMGAPTTTLSTAAGLAATATAATAPTTHGQPPPRPSLVPCILTAAQLSRMKIPRRPALLDRWLCQGDLGYIFAPRGVGKTWMAMALPCAISRRLPLGLWQAGDPAPAPAEDSSSSASLSESPATAEPPAPAPAPKSAGGPPAAPPAPTSITRPLLPAEGEDLDPAPNPGHVPVLYVDGEMNLNHTQYRSDGLCMPLGNVCFLHHEHIFELQDRCINIAEAEDRQRLTEAIIQQGYQVVILDNLSSLACGVDENKGSDYEPLSHWLLELRRRKITVIVIHHAGRNGFMRGHSKREDACSWIIELRDARQEDEPGAKFVSHFAKPSRNTGDPLRDLLWHFTSDPAGNTEIKCELAINSDYEQFIQHVIEGVTTQADIAEMMGKHRGCVSKWAAKALQEGRLSGSPRRLLPPGKAATSVKTRVHANDDDDEDSLAGFREDDDANQ